jgi:hypothetical protein
MVYDSARNVTVLFGGKDWADTGFVYYGDTWEWDGTNWTQRSPLAGPSERSEHAMAYDGAREVSVLFAGSRAAEEYNDTWEWDGVDWVQQTPSMSPTERYNHAMAFDSAREVVVFFGGQRDGGYLTGDTWEYGVW